MDITDVAVPAPYPAQLLHAMPFLEATAVVKVSLWLCDDPSGSNIENTSCIAYPYCTYLK